MKILVLSQSEPDSYELVRLIEEGKNLGVEVEHNLYSNIKMDFNNGCKIFIGDRNIVDEFDAFILRSAKSRFGHFYGNYKGMIQYLANKNGKKVLNYRTNTIHDNWATKLYAYTIMAANDIPVVKTYNFATLEQLLENKFNLQFPLIAKEARGSHGIGVQILKDFNEIYDYSIEKPISGILFQEYVHDERLENKEDIRIITLGKEVIGGYKKIAPRGSIVTNIAAGGSTEKLELSEDIIDVTKKIIDVYEADFTGIDMILKDNKPQVLEVNRAPQFKGFETTTGINLAEKIIQFMMNP